MFDVERFLVFLGTSTILLVAPGPAILYIVTKTMEAGPRSGVFASLGLTAGNVVHVIAATLGLSALLTTSALAFSLVRYAGAAYLIYLGARQLLSKWRAPDASKRADRTVARSGEGRSSFRQGLVVNVLNPKVAVFFLAFFPQFIDPTRGNATLQILILGTVFVALTLLVDVAYALSFGLARDTARKAWSGRTNRASRVAEFVPGLLYIGLGVAAAVTPVERRG